MPTFYRIVPNDRAAVDDFLSHMARGRKPPHDPAMFPLWDGVSVYSTNAAAQDTARYFWPRLGRFLAVLQVPEAGSIAYEKTTRHPFHFTLWGDPDAMVECVVAILPVDAGPTERSQTG